MTEIEILIQKYLHGETNEVENKQLHRWIHESQVNEKRFYAEKDIWDTLRYQSKTNDYEVNLELELLKTRLKQEQGTSTHYLFKLMRIAAILLVAFGLGWATRFIHIPVDQQDNLATMQEIFVPKGQVNQVFLSDGTRIWINSETRIIAPSLFSEKERLIKLSGEAYFEVARDPDRPFRIEVDGQLIEVLGTSFNVRAYENSLEIETTLASGQIRLNTGNQSVVLKPGEQSVYDKVNHQLKLNKVNPVLFSTWKDGRFEFQNEDLLEVFKVVERWYDVDIEVNKEYFQGMHFTGVIKRNKDAKHFLEMLNLSIPIRYEIRSDKVMITPR